MVSAVHCEIFPTFRIFLAPDCNSFSFEQLTDVNNTTAANATAATRRDVNMVLPFLQVFARYTFKAGS
jgi:hypothetical protein